MVASFDAQARTTSSTAASGSVGSRKPAWWRKVAGRGGGGTDRGGGPRRPSVWGSGGRRGVSVVVGVVAAGPATVGVVSRGQPDRTNAPRYGFAGQQQRRHRRQRWQQQHRGGSGGGGGSSIWPLRVGTRPTLGGAGGGSARVCS